MAPLFVIWLGLGIAPKIGVSVLLALFSIVVDAVLGLRTVDPDVLALSRINRAGWLRRCCSSACPAPCPRCSPG